MRRLAIVSAALAVLATAALAASSGHAGAIQKIDGAFAFDGRKIRVEIFRPAGAEPAPAALVLHGASGVGQGFYVYPFAKALARRGVAAAVVRYYDGLGRRKGKASPAIFRTRDRILRAAIDYVMTRKDVRPDGVGVYGMSLGGFHALSLGVQDKRVKSVVSLGGALSSHIPDRQVAGLPPTLILHGSLDRVVSVKRAVRLKRAMAKYDAPGEIKIYKGEGHSLSRKAHGDAVESVARFISESLRPTRQVAAAPDG